MKNPIQLPKNEVQNLSEIKARKAIRRIQKWMEEKYPVLASVAKTQLIIECLIELAEEKKVIIRQ